MTKQLLESMVPGHEGPCTFVWLNRNQVHYRLSGVTGFFRNTRRVWWWPKPVTYGKEFHGRVINSRVWPCPQTTL